MDISVVIPTYQRPQALKKCLEALMAQSYPGAWEVVVVNDGGETTVLASLLLQFSQTIDIRLHSQKNAGPATARNKGVELAKGQYIAFLDDDCEPDEHWLSNLYAQAQKQLMVGGQTINKLKANSYSQTSQDLVSFLYEVWKGTPWFFFTSNNFMLSRQAFLDVGGFDQNFRTSAGEDREFCLRWQHLGYQMRYCQEAIIRHSHDQTLRSFWKMHFKYGKATIPLRRSIRNFNLNPPSIRLSFYWQLLKYTGKSGDNVLRKFKVMTLAAISQLATFSGFFVASWSGSDKPLSVEQNGDYAKA